MRKLFITCNCGQQMQVPRSAIGKMGQCPSCGEKIPITRETTSRTRAASLANKSSNASRWGNQQGPSMDAKQRFGRAVDLYCAGKFGEALVIFNELHQEFPDSQEIAKARNQCIEARNRDPLNLPGPMDGQVMGDTLDENIIRDMRRIVVGKMLHGESDAVQLQAAELIARMAGLLDQPNAATPDTENHDDSRHSAEGNDTVQNGAGPANGNGSATEDSSTLNTNVEEISE